MSRIQCCLLVAATLLAVSCNRTSPEAVKAELVSLQACEEMARDGLRPIAAARDQRFLGKVQNSTALCRGGNGVMQFHSAPWVDWANYWGAGDARSKAPDLVKQAGHLGPTQRGVDGALLDLEYERVELIKPEIGVNTTAWNGNLGLEPIRMRPFARGDRHTSFQLAK